MEKNLKKMCFSLQSKFYPNKISFIGMTALYLYKNIKPPVWFIISTIDVISLYSEFTDIYSSSDSFFDHYVLVDGEILFVKEIDQISFFDNDFSEYVKKNLYLNENKTSFVFSLQYSPDTDSFYDKKNDFPSLTINSKDSMHSFMDAVLAKISFESQDFINFFINSIFFGMGYYLLEYLDKKKKIENLIPELWNLKTINHNKEYHPEGNAYDHSLLVVKHINTHDPALFFAALFHDLGKFLTYQETVTDSMQKFPYHSKYSVDLADYYLNKIQILMPYYPDFKQKAVFCIDNHMSIPNIQHIDLKKKSQLLQSPYVFDLLKLYKADLSASMRKLDQYAIVKMFVNKNYDKYKGVGYEQKSTVANRSSE